MTPLERAAEDVHGRRWSELGFDGLLPFEKNHVGVFWLVAEVMNGGIEQFLYNSSGDLANYTREGLKAIGAVTTLALFEEALAMIPCGYCEDGEERWRRLQQLTDDAFRVVSDKLQNYPEEVERLSFDLLVREYREMGLLEA